MRTVTGAVVAVYLVTQDVVEEVHPGGGQVIVQAGQYLTPDAAESLGLIEAPAVRTAKVEAPRNATRRRQ